MSCAIIGDSIAVGLSHFIHGCTVIAKVGMSSAWILAHAPAGNYDTVYISSGSNDPDNPHLILNLEATREDYKGRVVWIAPVNGKARSSVYIVAKERGDRVVTFTPGPDGVHPRSYPLLAAQATVRDSVKS